MEESKKASSGSTCLDRKQCINIYQLVFGMHANLTEDSADNPGNNPEILSKNEQHAQRQREAGERVLTRVILE